MRLPSPQACFIILLLLPPFSLTRAQGIGSSGVEFEWVRELGVADAPGWDVITDMITDDIRRRVCVTGTSSSPSGAIDFLTVCYNLTGSEVWSARFDGPVGGTDKPVGLGADALGNIYVAGTGQGTDTGWDIVVVKYNLQGQEQWVARNDTQIIRILPRLEGSASDVAVDMTVLSDGSIIVVGQAANNLVTVRFDSAGNVSWSEIYNGPSFGAVPSNDRALHVSADSDGNSIVVSRTEAFTILNKYDEFGNRIWTESFPENGALSCCEIGALALDGDGSIYIAGYEGHLDNPRPFIKKYLSDSTPQWAIEPQGLVRPTALGLDSDKNVYVAGTEKISLDQWDFVTIKYDQGGKVQWRSWYDGPDSGVDAVVEMAVDNGVYVTGSSPSKQPNPDYGPNYDWATVHYDPSGIEKWVLRFDGIDGRADRPVAIGRLTAFGRPISENLFVAGVVREVDTGDDFGVIRYILNEPNQPQQAWIARTNGPGANVAKPSDMAVDDDGNVFVSGSIGGAYLYQNRDRRYLTVKYTSLGELAWSNLDSSEGQFGETSVLELSADGGPVVSGFKSSPQINWETVKYDAEGAELWNVAFTPTEGLRPNQMLIGPDESIIVANEFAIVRYNAGGMEEWTSTGTHVLAVDSGGFVYTVYQPFMVSAQDPVTLSKRSPTSTIVWTIAFDTSVQGVSGIQVDQQGDIFVTGPARTNQNQDKDMMVAKFDPNGNMLWLTVDETEEHDVPQYLALEPGGGVVILGTIGRGDTDLATRRFDAAGQLMWRQRFDGDSPGEIEHGDSIDRPHGLAVDRFGEVYLLANSGFGFDNGFPTDLQLVKYGADGSEDWSLRHPGPNFDEPVGFGFDATDGIYVSQWSRSERRIEKIVTLKFRQTGLATNTDSSPDRRDLEVGKVFPNPVSHIARIEYQLHSPAQVEVSVYNVLGQRVAMLRDRFEMGGKNSLEWSPGVNLSSGIYFFRFEANDRIAIRSAVLLKE